MENTIYMEMAWVMMEKEIFGVVALKTATMCLLHPFPILQTPSQFPLQFQNHQKTLKIFPLLILLYQTLFLFLILFTLAHLLTQMPLIPAQLTYPHIKLPTLVAFPVLPIVMLSLMLSPTLTGSLKLKWGGHVVVLSATTPNIPFSIMTPMPFPCK